MLVSDMKTKDYVEIWIPNKDNDYDKFRSRVESVSEDSAVILAPLSKAGWHPVHSGDFIVIIHCRDGKVHRFTSTVDEINVYKNTKLIKISSKGEGTEYNRRQYYRADTIVDAKIEYEGTEKLSVAKALITNISGCGAGLRIGNIDELGIGNNLKINMKLLESDVSLTGVIVRKDETLDAVYPYYIGVQFHKIDTARLHIILKFVNDCQRRLMMARSGIA